MRVLIGYDGSEHSDAAIEDLKLAGLPRDAEVFIASIGDLLMSGPEISEVIGEVLTPLRVKSGLQKALNNRVELALHIAAERKKSG